MSVAPIALTCGEPAGIGPEIAEAAWSQLRDAAIPFFLIGDITHLPGSVPAKEITRCEDAENVFAGALPVLHRDFGAPRTPARPDKTHAAHVVDTIREAVSLARDNRISAICTNPIHKKALQSGAGFAFPGHTEFLAHLAGVERVVMMLAGPDLRVVPTTIHIALRDVAKALTPDLVEQTIRITERALRRDFDIDKPVIAVAGLNPHAGEGGNMGTEELEFIEPLIKRLSSEMRLKGPLSADTMFHAAARKGYDAAVCMYHDQALIPIKTLAFDKGVNVTLGLPFVRTSPDHGTAFDIAGTGTANPSSLIAALELAATLAERRKAV